MIEALFSYAPDPYSYFFQASETPGAGEKSPMSLTDEVVVATIAEQLPTGSNRDEDHLE